MYLTNLFYMKPFSIDHYLAKNLIIDFSDTPEGLTYLGIVDRFNWATGHLSKLSITDLAEISITSNVNIIEAQDNNSELFSIDEIKDFFVEVNKASGNKCARCWKVLDEVKNIGEICFRCEEVINVMGFSNLNN